MARRIIPQIPKTKFNTKKIKEIVEYGDLKVGLCDNSIVIYNRHEKDWHTLYGQPSPLRDVSLDSIFDGYRRLSNGSD